MGTSAVAEGVIGRDTTYSIDAANRQTQMQDAVGNLSTILSLAGQVGHNYWLKTNSLVLISAQRMFS